MTNQEWLNGGPVGYLQEWYSKSGTTVRTEMRCDLPASSVTSLYNGRIFSGTRSARRRWRRACLALRARLNNRLLCRLSVTKNSIDPMVIKLATECRTSIVYLCFPQGILSGIAGVVRWIQCPNGNEKLLGLSSRLVLRIEQNTSNDSSALLEDDRKTIWKLLKLYLVGARNG